MQGCATILIISYLAMLGKTDSVSEDRNSAAVILKDANLNRHKLAIFPKNTMKFVATPAPHTNTAYSYNHKPKVKIMPKMSFQVTPVPKSVTSTTKHAKRKPLMKLRTFTITSLSNGKFHEIQKDPSNVHVNNKPNNQIGVNTRKTPVKEQEHIDTDVFVPEESKISVNSLQNFSKTDNNIPINNKDKESGKAKDTFLLEEEQDRNEFIFLEDDVQQHNIEDVTSDIDQEFDADFETTTEFIIAEKLERVKRSKNIIEEENMASTVTVPKFTGRDTRLDNTFYFKNINS